jgi:hypothetical protein
MRAADAMFAVDRDSPPQLPPLGDLYHYTTLDFAREILRAGRVQAYPCTLHRDMFGRDRVRTTLPVVWLSGNRGTEPTVVMKYFQARGVSAVGRLARVVLPADFQCQRFGAWCQSTGLGADWFGWMVRTSMTYPEHYWRVCTGDIPAADFLRVEVQWGTPRKDVESEADILAELTRIWRPVG